MSKIHQRSNAPTSLRPIQHTIKSAYHDIAKAAMVFVKYMYGSTLRIKWCLLQISITFIMLLVTRQPLQQSSALYYFSVASHHTQPIANVRLASVQFIAAWMLSFLRRCRRCPSWCCVLHVTTVWDRCLFANPKHTIIKTLTLFVLAVFSAQAQ